MTRLQLTAAPPGDFMETVINTKINEICSKLYTISQDPEVKDVYRKWAEQARKYIYEE